MHGLASVWFARRKEEEALAIVREVIELRRRHLGGGHGDTVASEKMLAAWMEEPGEHDVHEILQDEVEFCYKAAEDSEEPAQQEVLEEKRHNTQDIHQPIFQAVPLEDSLSLSREGQPAHQSTINPHCPDPEKGLSQGPPRRLSASKRRISIHKRPPILIRKRRYFRPPAKAPKQHTALRARVIHAFIFIALLMALISAAAALFLLLSTRSAVRLLRFIIDVIDLLEGRGIVVRD